MKYGLLFLSFFLLINPSRACSPSLEKALQKKDWSAMRHEIDEKRCPVEMKVLTWHALRKRISGLQLSDYTLFLKNSADWPWLWEIKREGESLTPLSSPQDVLSFFKNFDPKTGNGALAYLKASKPHHQKILKRLWTTIQLSESDQNKILTLYGKELNASDHLKRATFLVDENRIQEAKILLPFLTKKSAQLIQSRLFLLSGKKTDFSSENPGFLLNKLGYLRAKRDPSVYSFVTQYKAILYKQYPEKTWKEVHILVRRLLEKKNLNTALSLITGHQFLKESEYAEAEWMRGWLSLKVGKNKEASSIFEHLFHTVSSPLSKSRMAFWRAEASKDNVWYEKACSFPTKFYGQLACKKLGKPLSFNSHAPATKADKNNFEKKSLVQAIHVLKKSSLSDELKPFFYISAKKCTTPGERLLLLTLAKTHSLTSLMATAEEISRFEEIHSDLAYPWMEKSYLTLMKECSPSFAHAVIRKESLFDPTVVSPVGALGYMQVMPETGKMLAKKMGEPFSLDQLKKDSLFNVKLGCAYLTQQLDQFDGHKILTLAAYNAGPKPVKEWIELFGDPRKPHVDWINWVENIPYGETRNYVQRVYEAYQVYQEKRKNH